MSQEQNNIFSKILWLSPFLVFFITYLFLHAWFKSETISMPNLIGSNLIEATKTCSSLSLRPQIVQIHVDADLPQATITHQIPFPGSAIKKEQTAYIAITEKPACKTTPECIGMSKEAIKSMLEPLNIKVKFHPIEYRYVTDHCFCQWPAAGTPLKSKNVTCYIAQKSQRLVILPDFKNQSLDNVKKKCAEYNIQVKTDRITQNEAHVIVYNQQPKAGSIIDLNKKDLTIYLSLSPQR